MRSREISRPRPTGRIRPRLPTDLKSHHIRLIRTHERRRIPNAEKQGRLDPRTPKWGTADQQAPAPLQDGARHCPRGQDEPQGRTAVKCLPNTVPDRQDGPDDWRLPCLLPKCPLTGAFRSVAAGFSQSPVSILSASMPRHACSSRALPFPTKPCAAASPSSFPEVTSSTCTTRRSQRCRWTCRPATTARPRRNSPHTDSMRRGAAP